MFTFSTVANPSFIVWSTVWRNFSIFSGMSIISILMGKSSESIRIFAECNLLFAPKPSIPRVTVAPASP